jgi:hypothetical protein
VQQELAVTGGADANNNQPEDVDDQVEISQLTQQDPPSQTPTTNAPEVVPQQDHIPVGLEHKLEEQFYIALVEFDGQQICNRPTLPRQHNSRNFIRLTSAMDKHILPSQLDDNV